MPRRPFFKMSALVVFSILFANCIEISRAVEGTTAEPQEVPWQVGIIAPETSQFCGGSLISEEWVLTAAHCVEVEDTIFLRFGAYSFELEDEDNVTEINSSVLITHELYNEQLHNDIALVKLPAPIQFTDKIKSIRLPKYGETIGTGVNITVTGWGTTCGVVRRNSTLSRVSLTTISNEKCTSLYGPAVVRCNNFCAATEDSPGVCTGDSGGPAVAVDSTGAPVLHGVVSFGSANTTIVGLPSGFIRTEALLSWIERHTGLQV